MKKLVHILVLIFAVFITSCDAKAEGKGNNRNQNANVGMPAKQSESQRLKAPDFTLSDVHGNWVSLSDLSGKVILLNFWGTWCPPCRKEIPDFIELYNKHNEAGLEIVGITLQSGTPDKIQAFMEDWDMNYTVLTDIRGNETQFVTQQYGQAIGRPINGIPTTFIIDREGFIVKTYVGPRTEEVFYQDLHPYL